MNKYYDLKEKTEKYDLYAFIFKIIFIIFLVVSLIFFIKEITYNPRTYDPFGSFVVKNGKWFYLLAIICYLIMDAFKFMSAKAKIDFLEMKINQISNNNEN